MSEAAYWHVLASIPPFVLGAIATTVAWWGFAKSKWTDTEAATTAGAVVVAVIATCVGTVVLCNALWFAVPQDRPQRLDELSTVQPEAK